MPMHLSPRCGARTRSNGICSAPAVAGKMRCRMHGGAKGSGAPKGNQNALKHGYYARTERETRKAETQSWRDLKRKMGLFRGRSKEAI
jgi:glucans biosynthesis protein